MTVFELLLRAQHREIEPRDLYAHHLMAHGSRTFCTSISKGMTEPIATRIRITLDNDRLARHSSVSLGYWAFPSAGDVPIRHRRL
jgi:hypothetical protein